MLNERNYYYIDGEFFTAPTIAISVTAGVQKKTNDSYGVWPGEYVNELNEKLEARKHLFFWRVQDKPLCQL